MSVTVGGKETFHLYLLRLRIIDQTETVVSPVARYDDITLARD